VSEPRGPRVELPEDLAEELERAAEGDPTTPAPPSAPPAPAPEPPQAEASGARDFERELAELQDRYLRLAAEFDNYRRRSMRERQDLHNFANEALIKELLPTVDNLGRALGHARPTEEGQETSALRQGVELTMRSLLQTLENAGVTRVEAEGKEFDPQFHEAVQRVPTDAHPPNHVVNVLQSGWLLRGRLLRPALVAVSVRPAESDGS
jgi:molecular chaperone GrpE